MSDPVAAVYTAIDTIKAAVDAGAPSTASASYEHLISSVSSTDPVKQLAADNLPTFLHHFPALQEKALNAQFDLIEDNSLLIRIHAIRGLEVLSKSTPSLIPRVSDVLVQLLQIEDPNELATVKATFAELFVIDHRASFNALLVQARDNEDRKIKDAALEFLIIQLNKYWKQITAPTVTPIEQLEIANGIKGILTASADTLSPKDAQFLLSHLLRLKVVREDPNVKTDVSSIIAAQAKLDKEFDASNEAAVNGLIAALRGLEHMKKYNVDGSVFIKYFLSKVLPSLDTVPAESRILLVRAVANAVAADIDSKTARTLVPQVWEATKHHLSLPSKAAVAEFKADDTTHLLFCLSEAWLYLTIQLAALSPEAARDVLGLFISTGQPSDFAADSKKNDTVQRLTHLQASAQTWGKTIQPAIAAAKKELKEEKEEEKKKLIKQKLSSLMIDQRVAGSIKSLVAPLLEKVPVITAGGSVSWKKTKDKAEAGTKPNGTAVPGKQEKGKKAGDKSEKKSDGGKGKKTESKKGGKGDQASSSSSSSQQQGHQSRKQKGDSEHKEAPANKKRKAEGGGAGQPPNARASTAPAASSSSSLSTKENGSSTSGKRKRGNETDRSDNSLQQQQQQQKSNKKRKSDAGQNNGGGGGGGQQQQQSQSKKKQKQLDNRPVSIQQQQQMYQQVAAQAQAAAAQAYLSQMQAASQQFYNPLVAMQQMAAMQQGGQARGGESQRTGGRGGSSSNKRGGRSGDSGGQQQQQRQHQAIRSNKGSNQRGRRGGSRPRA